MKKLRSGLLLPEKHSSGFIAIFKSPALKKGVPKIYPLISILNMLLRVELSFALITQDAIIGLIPSILSEERYARY